MPEMPYMSTRQFSGISALLLMGLSLAGGVAAESVSAGTTRENSLRGTLVHSLPEQDRAIVADPAGIQRAYTRGDDLPGGGRIAEIHRDYVLIRMHDGRVAQIDFSWSGMTAPAQADSHDENGGDLDKSRRLERYRKLLYDHPGLLLQQVGAIPASEAGHFLGYRVTRPEDEALLEYLGLKPGDLLTAVNGVPFRSMANSSRILGAMTGTGKLSFTVQRGRQTLVVYH